MAEMSLSEITKIEKLNGTNYQSWKYNVKLILIECGLWGFTQEDQETPPAADASATVKSAFRLRSDKAYSLIALNVKKDLQGHISSTTDPLAAWKFCRSNSNLCQSLRLFVSIASFTQQVRRKAHT